MLFCEKSIFPFSKTSAPILPSSAFGSCLPPSRKDPFIAPRPSLAATMHLSFQAQIVTHTFILEAVGGEKLFMHLFGLDNKIISK